MLSVMPNVIQKSARTLVLHGLIDYEVIAEGTRIAIQNMTCVYCLSENFLSGRRISPLTTQ